jgi:cell division protein FtsW (lipid II flippase)
MSVPRHPLQASWDLRRPERHLLLWCLLCVSLGFFMGLGAIRGGGRAVALVDLVPLLIYAASLVGLHLALVLSHYRGDYVLPGAVAFLAGFGVLSQYRMGAFDPTHPLALGHFLLPAGLILMLGATIGLGQGRYRSLAAGIWVWAGLSLVLVILVLATGQRFRGGVYGVNFITPTELLKVTVPLFLAAFIDRWGAALADWGPHRVVPPLRALAPLVGFWVLLCGLLLVQRDLGLVVILGLTLLVMLYLGTRRLGYLILGALGAVGLAWAALHFFLHGQRRIASWIDPFDDPTGDSWQILQGLSGMYAGGLWGEGFGRGNPEYTPIAESDFIYSVIGEEWGFVGCALVLAFFLVAFTRALHMARGARARFGLLLGVGLTTVIAIQTFLNIGGVTKFVPMTGITLPFISHGGSSLLTGFVAMGLVLALYEVGAPLKPAGTRPPARPRAAKPVEVQAPPAPDASTAEAPARKRRKRKQATTDPT